MMLQKNLEIPRNSKYKEIILILMETKADNIYIINSHIINPAKNISLKSRIIEVLLIIHV